MCEVSEKPPTSAVLLDSCDFSQVIFNNVERCYIPGGDITCCYTLTESMVPHRRDWVGIFRVGWKTTRDYYTFMWTPLTSNPTVQQKIQFKAYYLPKDDEYYQFCYVDQNGVVRGASVPFQFRAETGDEILVVTPHGEVEEIELQNKNLHKKNKELKASCARLKKQNVDLQKELTKMQELQNSLESLRSNKEKMELELDFLRKENEHLKELDGCREEELLQLKEQIQNVSSDKDCLETRLQTALDARDQLQQQNQNLRKELEEQKHLFQILQAKKNEADEEKQKLRAENEALKRLLPAGEVPSSSAVSQDTAPVPDPEVALLFGNPYRGEMASKRKCPVCNEVLPKAAEMWEAHVQSHFLQCPHCSETFEESDKQVFDDHLFCHGLE